MLWWWTLLLVEGLCFFLFYEWLGRGDGWMDGWWMVGERSSWGCDTVFCSCVVVRDRDYQCTFVGFVECLT
ncbi:hypothetical protein HOY80DRAFT_784955 [Tuber brumale]|nr:hypothetical protein HOY80DRAFT_784955 [Tuber brumale]